MWLKYVKLLFVNVDASRIAFGVGNKFRAHLRLIHNSVAIGTRRLYRGEFIGSKAVHIDVEKHRVGYIHNIAF